MSIETDPELTQTLELADKDNKRYCNYIPYVQKANRDIGCFKKDPH